jgi:hypothetical protein
LKFILDTPARARAVSAIAAAMLRIALQHTQFAKAICGTIRLKLLKIGALVRTSVRRIKFAMASSCPYQREIAVAPAQLISAADPYALGCKGCTTYRPSTGARPRKALTRMISAVFRRGGDVSFVVEEMEAVFDPRGGAWMEGRYVPSLLAAIGDVIERHMIEIGFLPARKERAASWRTENRRWQSANFRPATPHSAHGAMPDMRRGCTDPDRRLRPMHQLRLLQMLVKGNC